MSGKFTWTRRIISLKDNKEVTNKDSHYYNLSTERKQGKDNKEEDGIVCTTQNGTVKLREPLNNSNLIPL